MLSRDANSCESFVDFSSNDPIHPARQVWDNIDDNKNRDAFLMTSTTHDNWINRVEINEQYNQDPISNSLCNNMEKKIIKKLLPETVKGLTVSRGGRGAVYVWKENIWLTYEILIFVILFILVLCLIVIVS